MQSFRSGRYETAGYEGLPSSAFPLQTSRRQLGAGPSNPGPRTPNSRSRSGLITRRNAVVATAVVPSAKPETKAESPPKTTEVHHGVFVESGPPPLPSHDDDSDLEVDSVLAKELRENGKQCSHAQTPSCISLAWLPEASTGSAGHLESCRMSSRLLIHCSNSSHGLERILFSRVGCHGTESNHMSIGTCCSCHSLSCLGYSWQREGMQVLARTCLFDRSHMHPIFKPKASTMQLHCLVAPAAWPAWSLWQTYAFLDAILNCRCLQCLQRVFAIWNSA